MAKISQQFADKWFNGEDFDKEGRDLVVDYVEEEKVGKDTKLAMHFDGEEKALPLNKTNAEKIAKIFGLDDTDDWPGMVINLYRSTAQMNGKNVPCVRARTPRQSGSDSDRASTNPGAKRPKVKEEQEDQD